MLKVVEQHEIPALGVRIVSVEGIPPNTVCLVNGKLPDLKPGEKRDDYWRRMLEEKHIQVMVVPERRR